MSHICTLKVELRDLAAIKAACQRMGWQLRQGQATFRWYGRYIGDYPDFEKRLRSLGINPADYGKCTHAIRVPGADYEIGLVQQGNKFVPLWDNYRPGGLQALTADNGMAGFYQAYVLEKSKLEARRKGLPTREVKQKDGSIKLVIEQRGAA